MDLKPAFVFCADLHIDDGAWTTRPAIYGDAYCSFQQIVDYCIAHRLPLVLGGDVLEKKSNAARPIAKLCDGLTQMQEALVPVYYIQGNHEYDRNAPWLSVHPWPVHLHKQCLPFSSVAGLRVYGLDWLPRGEIQEEFKQVPADTDILITHQVWKDFMGNVGRTECELTEVHHVGIVLAGDFHVTKTVESVNSQGRPIKMLSPGSTCMQDMGEAPDKYFFVVGRDETGAIQYAPVQLRTRQLIKHVVDTPEQLDDLCSGKLIDQINNRITFAMKENYSADILKPLVRVKFAKNIPDAYLRVVTMVGERAHLFCEALAANDKTRSAGGAAVQEKTNLLLIVAELLRGDEAAYKIAESLLTSVDPAREIDVLCSKFTQENTDAAAETRGAELGAPPLQKV
jgi:hypothetical protein